MAGAAPEAPLERPATDDASVRFKLAVPSVDESELRRALGEADATVEEGSERFIPSEEERDDYPDAGFSPMVWITAAASIGHLAELAFELWQRHRYGGLIIDARGEELLVREHPALPRGRVIALGPGDARSLEEPPDANALAEIVRALVSAGR